MKQVRCKTLRFVFGDQLNAAHSWFHGCDENTLYVIAELPQETNYVLHHQQKLLAFFAAMQSFAAALEKAGHRVLHLTLDESSGFTNLEHLFANLVQQTQCQRMEFQRPDEYRLLAQLNQLLPTLGVEFQLVDSEHFFLPFDDIPAYFKPQRAVRMEAFYRKMRQRFNLLMSAEGPEGGQWNFDQDNRQTLKAVDLAAIPKPLVFANDVTAIRERLERHQVAHFGEANDTLLWPINRQQALQLLDYFCNHLLVNFGRFQDAMTQNSEHAWSLYHARLSFALNTKMISPQLVLAKVIAHYQQHSDTIGLAQVEGFVRQILGWREYVRGMYWVNQPGYGTSNHLQANAALPSWFWTGKTRMNCLHQCIDQSLQTAYAHHIQRLMVIGNFSLLAGLNPDEVDAWYLGIYIDAIEWVEQPNTRGMVLFADGGLIASKPYAASGNYINKMSDYCRTCTYQVKEKTGAKACPFNALYWHFLVKHEDKFKANGRMALVYKQWQKNAPETQQAILAHADNLLSQLETL